MSDSISVPITSKTIRLEQPHIVAIHLHLLRRLYKPILDSDSCFPVRPLSTICLVQQLHSFIHSFGLTSHRFFESSFLAIKMFFKETTFPMISVELPLLPAVNSLFKAEILSVFVFVKRAFAIEKCCIYSKIIAGLKVQLKNPNDLNFLNVSSPCYLLHLKRLVVDVDNSNFRTLTEALKTHPTITHLNLKYSSEGAVVLGEVLKVNSVITQIDLCDNSIGNGGVISLAHALTTNSTVTCLKLRKISIDSTGAVALSEMLKVNSSIRNLVLDNNSIGNDGVIALANMLMVNSTVLKMDLKFCSIGMPGVLVLTEALKVNSSISEMNLGYNFIGNAGIISLVEAFKVHSSLTVIDLSSNCIRDTGARALVEAFKVHPSITRINLRSNFIGDVGAVHLVELLQCNFKIRQINLLITFCNFKTKDSWT
ncbi:hypothetical protein GEMRC1_009969 [Eukaryota sp. GEM-RC1]